MKFSNTIFVTIFFFFITACQSTKEIQTPKQEPVQDSTVAAIPFKPLTTEEKIASIADQYQVKIGVAAKNLTNGKIITVNQRERIPVTSMLKVPILISYYQAVSEGKIKSTASAKLTKQNKVGGSGMLQFMNGEYNILLSDAAKLTVISSDNTAANLILDAFGSNIDQQTGYVNQVMANYGFIDTKILNKFLRPDLKAETDDSKAFGVGYSTAADLAVLMEKLYDGKMVSSDVSLEILEIMRNSNDDTMCPRFMPLDDPSFSLAHRSGGTTRYKGDFGLLTYKGQSISFAVICENLVDNKPTIENNGIIAAGLITKLIYEELLK